MCRTVKVTVDQDTKFTAAAKGRDAAFDETLEFILGRKEISGHDDLMVEIEVWDYRLINHFKVRSHAAALPCPALPCPALPCPVLPCPAPPRPALP